MAFQAFTAMEERIRRHFTNCGFIIIIILFVFVINGVNSEVYTVGGDDDKWDTGTNYLTWSEKYNFSVGDVLVFEYVKGQHNAFEVTEATYTSCNTSNGVLARYESGNDQVKLTEAKNYWFICDIQGHCLGGMRLTIDVKETNSTSITNNTPPPAGSSTPPDDSNNCHAYKRPKMWVYFTVLLILLKLYS